MIKVGKTPVNITFKARRDVSAGPGRGPFVAIMIDSRKNGVRNITKKGDVFIIRISEGGSNFVGWG
jgi:hypothetical protein